jgi:WD40 repeat protein
LDSPLKCLHLTNIKIIIKTLIKIIVNELADDEVLMITGSRDSTLKVWAVPLAPPPDAADAEDEGELSDGGEDAYEINGGGDYPHDDGTDDELMRLPTGGSGEMEQNNWQTDDLNPEDQQEQRAAPPAANDDYGQPPGRFGERLSSPSSPPAETPISPNSSQLVKSKPRCLMTLSGHTQSVRCLAADYPFIVSGSYDCKVRIWRLDEGRCTAVLMGHTDKVYTVALDRLGGLCFSGSLDYTVRVWNIQTGTCLHTLEGHTDLVGLLQHRYLPYSMSWPRIPGSPVRTFPVPAAVNGGKQPGRKRKRSIATIYNSNHQQQPQLRFPVLISAAADRSIMMWDVRQL